tara:strand:- start:13982 stop:14713 length:732 start_codon:yes stop_codon:yes gene_type:complete
MNKSAIITGASRGIGEGIARYLAAQGYHLGLFARGEAALADVKASIEAEHPDIKVHIYPTDVSDLGAVTGAVADFNDQLGRVDVLVNNAGIARIGTSDVTPEDLQALLDINIKGVYNLTHMVAPIMKAQGSGYIINMSSRAAKIAMPPLGAYALTKYAVNGFNEAIFTELAPYNIKCTAICPSVIETEMTKDFDFPNDEKIQVSDIVTTVDYLINLGPNALIKEVVVDCQRVVKAIKSPIKRD